MGQVLADKHASDIAWQESEIVAEVQMAKAYADNRGVNLRVIAQVTNAKNTRIL